MDAHTHTHTLSLSLSLLSLSLSLSICTVNIRVPSRTLLRIGIRINIRVVGIRVGIRLHTRVLDAQSVILNLNPNCTLIADTALTQSASQSSRSADTCSWQCPTPTPLMARESPYLATRAPLPLSAPPTGCQCRECLVTPQSVLAQNDSGFTSGQSSDHRSAHLFPPLPPTD